ncbi:NAD-dependent epimerase/dehydratase family protein [Micromonospora sp. NPDC049114]|uniref:NAD-dependent epimerase/dehydratase family protein n=1 Tax=unclassified Micromonospora TaxID=2617518 RepID=UPI0033C19396
MDGMPEDPQSTTVLVIGATGYAGSHVAKAFAAAGYQVAALQRPDGRPVPPAYRPVPGDITDPSSLKAAADGFDLVIQIAWVPGDVESRSAEAIMAAGARLIHTSGTDVLGPGTTYEDTVPRPPAVVAWRADMERRVVAGGGIIVRPALIYGNRGGVIRGTMVPVQERLGTGVYLGHAGIQWPVVHVEDLARLYLAVAQRAAGGTRWNGVAENLPVADIVAAAAGGRAICWPADQEPPEEIAPIAELYLMDHVVSADRTRREMGWEPVHTSLVEYYRRHPHG